MTENTPAASGPGKGALRGLAGGLAGAVLGHLFVTWCLRCGGEFWLKGPYGPGQFFGISAYLGILYGCIGWSLSGSAGPALIGFLGNFLGIALPMAILTHLPQPMRLFLSFLASFPDALGRLLHWTGLLNPLGLAWTLAVIVIYAVANWGTTIALGAVLCPARRWPGAGAAVLGSFGSYLALKVFLFIIPAAAQGRWRPESFMPSPLDLLTGALLGTGIGAAVFLVRSRRREAPHA